MPMFNPPHPGRSLKRDCIEALGLTITEAADPFCLTVLSAWPHQQRHTFRLPWGSSFRSSCLTLNSK